MPLNKLAKPNIIMIAIKHLQINQFSALNNPEAVDMPWSKRNQENLDGEPNSSLNVVSDF